jgi:hypothetical protein
MPFKLYFHVVDAKVMYADRTGVRLKAPHWSGYSSAVRRDWKQLIGRKLAHTTAVKTGLGETPLKGGSPEE